MKKIMIALVAVTFTCSAMAQTKKTDTSMTKMSSKSGMKMDKMENCVMNMDGKMMTMKGGKTSHMTHAMTMSNGTMVMPDCTMKMKNGKKMMLKDGQCVMMDGKVKKAGKMGEMKEDEMKM